MCFVLDSIDWIHSHSYSVYCERINTKNRSICNTNIIKTLFKHSRSTFISNARFWQMQLFVSRFVYGVEVCSFDFHVRFRFLHLLWFRSATSCAVCSHAFHPNSLNKWIDEKASTAFSSRSKVQTIYQWSLGLPIFSYTMHSYWCMAHIFIQNAPHENGKNQKVSTEFQAVTCVMVLHSNISVILKYYRSFRLDAFLGPNFFNKSASKVSMYISYYALNFKNVDNTWSNTVQYLNITVASNLIVNSIEYSRENMFHRRNFCLNKNLYSTNYRYYLWQIKRERCPVIETVPI